MSPGSRCRGRNRRLLGRSVLGEGGARFRAVDGGGLTGPQPVSAVRSESPRCSVVTLGLRRRVRHANVARRRRTQGATLQRACLSLRPLRSWHERLSRCRSPASRKGRQDRQEKPRNSRRFRLSTVASELVSDAALDVVSSFRTPRVDVARKGGALSRQNRAH